MRYAALSEKMVDDNFQLLSQKQQCRGQRVRFMVTLFLISPLVVFIDLSSLLLIGQDSLSMQTIEQGKERTVPENRTYTGRN